MLKSPGILLVTIFMVSTATLSQTSVPSAPKFELLIFHNNDMHARFEQTLSTMNETCTDRAFKAGKCYGGFARIAHIVRQARAAALAGTGPPVLYLNAGDTFVGTSWFTVFRYKIVTELMNALHPDAISFGNHEFDDGVSGLKPFIRNLTSPVLVANLVLDKEPSLANEPNLHKSILLDVNGTKVGIIGYLTNATKLKSSKNDVEYVDEVIAIREEVQRLKANGSNIIIALGHSGFDTDKKIAMEVDGIDLVIGGHTHTFLYNGKDPDSEKKVGPYPIWIQQSSGKSVPVVQAFAFTKYLGKLHIVINSDGKIEIRRGNPILLDNSIPQDEIVLALINRYRSLVMNITTKVVGRTNVLLDGHSKSCKSQECNLGNLITDAMVFHYSMRFKSSHKYWTDAPIAFMNGGSIRASIDTDKFGGNITMGDLFKVYPFKSKIVAVKMTGQALWDALENSVWKYDARNRSSSFLQLSGVFVVYDLSKEPGYRVVSAAVRSSKCQVLRYYSIKMNRHYKVLMPRFLAEGGDGFTMFQQFLPYEEMPYDELHTMIEYLKRISPVYYGIEGRITKIRK